MTNIGLVIIIATELGLTVIETVVHSGEKEREPEEKITKFQRRMSLRHAGSHSLSWRQWRQFAF